MKKYLFFYVIFGLLITNCKKNDDSVIPDVQQQQEEEQQEEPKTTEDFPVQNFMWQTMNAYYLWQGDIDNLSDSKFPDTVEGTEAYIAFLESELNPGDFFDNKLLFSEDRFSGYNENYKELTNFLSGIQKSNGLEFGLSLYGSGDDVLGFVNYVIKDSDASAKDIKRGDIFIGVNGTSLNLDNYQELLFGDDDTYVLNMVDIIDNVLTPNGKEIALTKLEGLVENPVLVSKVIEDGDKKIGYLMYNQFIGGSEENLNQIFTDFKSTGVTDLVLDLRYNLGGRGYTAALLASLIYGTNENDIFYKNRYNAKVEADFQPEELENYFVSTTGTAFGNSNTALNSLNLNTVYVLATDSSASASELVIVGLAPYVEVVHIGSLTVGKNQGSNTFVDDPENGNFYDPDREDQINPNNQWAIQPIIVTVENAAGFSDYSTGLVPDIELFEDIANLGVLGEPNEPMLARAIAEINGVSSKIGFETKIPVNLVASSKMFHPFGDNLVIDKIPASLKNNLKTQKKSN